MKPNPFMVYTSCVVATFTKCMSLDMAWHGGGNTHLTILLLTCTSTVCHPAVWPCPLQPLPPSTGPQPLSSTSLFLHPVSSTSVFLRPLPSSSLLFCPLSPKHHFQPELWVQFVILSLYLRHFLCCYSCCLVLIFMYRVESVMNRADSVYVM